MLSTNSSPVALVTGGGTGIGRGITEYFLSQGWRVVITGRRQEVLESAAAELDPTRVLAVRSDITSPDDRARALSQALSFGSLQAVILNAGLAPANFALEASDAEREELYAVNCIGPSALAVTAVEQMIQGRAGGLVVGISSIAEIVPFPGSSGDYGAAKAGLTRKLRGLQVTAAPHGIRVGVISPHWVKTEMATDAPIPEHEMIAVDDVTKALHLMRTLSSGASIFEIVLNNFKNPNPTP